ncbi:MAG: hypothetical protein ACYC40_04960 [Patescibacteria group bacterium]
MKSINQIARMNLERIFKDWDNKSTIIFSENEFDFMKEVVAECADGSAPDYFDYLESSGVLSAEDIDPERVVQNYVWGIRLGLREIPMLFGTKTMLERIVEEEEKECWIMNQNHFSHFVEERIIAEDRGYPVSEITVYRISDKQWKAFVDKAIGSND